MYIFFQLSADDILCNECYTLLQSASNQPNLPARAVGHHNVCYGCGKSILRGRTHIVTQECLERNIILRWTPAHQVLFIIFCLFYSF